MHMHWFTAKTARLLPQARQDDLVLMYSLLAMYIRVTCGIELNRVLLGIVSAPASELFYGGELQGPYLGHRTSGA